MAKRLAGDQKVVGTDRFTEPFKGCANPARVLRIFAGEVQNLEGTRQEDSDAFGVQFWAQTFCNSVPKLEQHDRRGGDNVASRTNSNETSPDRLRPTIDQRNTGVGIEQVGQSKILRVGVMG